MSNKDIYNMEKLSNHLEPVLSAIEEKANKNLTVEVIKQMADFDESQKDVAKMAQMLINSFHIKYPQT